MNVIKKIVILIILCAIVYSCQLVMSDNLDDELENNQYELIWSDEFDYTGLPDLTKWAYDTSANKAEWGKKEALYYTCANKKNAYVENGVLHIKAHKEGLDGKTYSSAKLISKTNWKYGKFEVCAKLPETKGTYSAVWMMTVDLLAEESGSSDAGEINILKHEWQEQGVIHASAQTKDYQWLAANKVMASANVDNIAGKFHRYTLEWTPESIKAFINDSLYFELEDDEKNMSKWLYNKPLNLVMDLAVDGLLEDSTGIGVLSFPQTMEIDYVRVYRRQDIKIEN